MIWIGFLDHGCMIQEHWIMASLSGKKIDQKMDSGTSQCRSIA